MQQLSSQETQSWLSWFLKGLLVVVMTIIVGRLAELQIIKGAYYRDLAENNRVRRIPITAARGKILARGGETLVGNKETKYEIVFSPTEGYEKREPTSDTKDVFSQWSREYLLGKTFSHIGGYLSEVNEDEVGKVDPSCEEKGARKLGSTIGRGGLESMYDCTLRGVDGEELVEVDTRGNKVRTIGTHEPIEGQDLHTTIDYGLQIAVTEALTGSVGAVVASDGMGQILALQSSPAFDPTDIAPALTDPKLPLFNRAIGGVYHPGSVYKQLIAVAALEDKTIDRSFRYEDTGVITVNEFSYTNWYFTQYGGREGLIDLPKALARSTDTFFYKLGEMEGIDRIIHWSKLFGLGEKTGIDLPGEVGGLLPSPEWKKAMKGESWFLGNTYHLSIGQGDLTVTPLAANQMTSVVASRGQLCTPYIVQTDTTHCKKVPIAREHFEYVIEGMKAACTTGGTAFPFFDFAIDGETSAVACKTGTAETFDDNLTHAWFTIFAPIHNPEIVLTVLVENGGEGSKVAAPIARKILDYWFYERTGKEVPGKTPTPSPKP